MKISTIRLILLAIVSTLVSAMDDARNASFFSLTNETTDLVEMVVANGNTLDKYIQLKPHAVYINNKIHSGSETIFHVFRREKSKKGSYEASWSVPPHTSQVHLKLKQNQADKLFIEHVSSKHQKTAPVPIQKVH